MLPERELPLLFHIGTLEAADRQRNYGESYEGHALSVSLDPEAWAGIARLGGYPWWALRKRGARFLDAHELTKAQRKLVLEWGYAKGYAEPATAYEISWYDDELEQECVTLCESREDAEFELEEEGRKLKRRRTFRTTQAFLDAIGAKRAAFDDFDRLLVLWAEQETDLDGVWWEDQYGPLSAPRGGIFPSRLGQWQRRLLRAQG